MDPGSLLLSSVLVTNPRCRRLSQKLEQSALLETLLGTASAFAHRPLSLCEDPAGPLRPFGRSTDRTE